MKKVLISLMIILLFVMISCGGDDKDNTENTGDTGNTGNSGNTSDTGDTGNSGNSGNSGNTGNTGDTGDSGNTGNTGNTGDTGDSGNTGNTGNSGNSGNTGDTGNSGDTGDEDSCSDSDKFCHSHDGLNWSDVSSDEMHWDDAITYCEDLDGRLPTISEMRTLIQNCDATEIDGACSITDDCISFNDCWNNLCKGCDPSDSGKYSVFSDISALWSSSEFLDDTNDAWYVNFYNGQVYSQVKTYGFFVRCVK